MAVDDIYTKSLLHFNGTDSSTTIVDESGKSWTANGNSQLDTATQKFGSAALLLDGTEDYVDTADTADHETGSGDFTIDFWSRWQDNASTQSLFGRRTDATGDGTGLQKDLFTLYYSSGTWTFHSVVNGVNKAKYTFSFTIPDYTSWYHIALVRSGSNLYIFKDGISQTLTTVTAISTNDLTFSLTGEKLTIGRYGNYNGFYFNGWIDEFRFSKGIARWTSNFTPPTTEYRSPEKASFLINFI